MSTLKANFSVTVGQLRSRFGSRWGGAYHGDPGNGLEFGDDEPRGVVKGVGRAIEIGDEADDRSNTPRVATSTVSFVADQFGRPIHVRLAGNWPFCPGPGEELAGREIA